MHAHLVSLLDLSPEQLLAHQNEPWFQVWLEGEETASDDGMDTDCDDDRNQDADCECDTDRDDGDDCEGGADMMSNNSCNMATDP